MAAKTPAVVLIVFNRPEVTKIVFERIRQTRPTVLMLVADGPRRDRAGESEACRLTRQIVENVTWPCKVLKDYAETNMGCGRRVASGIDWVFQNVEEAIILEDDCLPDRTFFRFCAELLEHYRGDERVMQISGSNLQFGRHRTEQSYYFSRYPHCWGWATWRRAWQLYDFDMEPWKADPKQCLTSCDDNSERTFWQATLDSVRKGQIDTWDYQWSLACRIADGLAVTPSVNMVTNIGLGSDATHTRSRLFAIWPAVGAMKFPLHHPSRCEANVEADKFTARRFFYKRSVLGKAAEMIRRHLFAAISHLRIGGNRAPEALAVASSSVRPR
jgi:hypothetical protein